jgi:hypothetical protein
VGSLIQVGIDPGKRQDPAAVTVAELDQREDGYHYVIRAIEHPQTGTR